MSSPSPIVVNGKRSAYAAGWWNGTRDVGIYAGRECAMTVPVAEARALARAILAICDKHDPEATE